MDATDIADAVREETKTELSRLGSSKSLYADTEGELERETVLAAMADATRHGAAAIEEWAGQDDPGGVFADAVARLRDQHETLVGELDGYEPGDPPAVVEAFGAAEDTVQRLGALVGWSLVAERKATQATGYFTGQADPQTASTVREFGGDYEAVREAALSALAGEDDAWLERATDAAIGVVEAAYDDYFETLESLGVNPKPVC